MYISAHIYGFEFILILSESTYSILINIPSEFMKTSLISLCVVFFIWVLRAFLCLFSLSLKFCIVLINYFQFSLQLLGLFCFHDSDPSINTILRNLIFNILLRPLIWAAFSPADGFEMQSQPCSSWRPFLNEIRSSVCGCLLETNNKA